MNKIQVFKSEQFGAIRTMVMPDGQIGFVGKDVAKALGYTNASKAVTMHVDEEDKVELQVYLDSQNGNAGQRRKTTFISESGLYSLVLSSKLPQAREFKRWVTSEVLPQIRQTGGYIPVREEESAEMILSKALQIMERTVKLQREELKQKSDALGQLAPLAEYADAVLLSPTCYTMTEVAKSLSMTVHELQHLLHSWGVIYRSPSGIWMLYADYLQQGYEAYRTRKGESVHGDVLWTSSYLVWTEKGKHFIHRLVGERIAA